MVGEEDSTRPRSASMLWQPFHLGVEVFLHGIELTGAQEKEEREGGHERKGGEEGERGGLRVKISLLYQMLSVSFGAVRRKEGLTGLSFVLILPIGISLLLSSSCPHLSLNPFLFFFFLWMMTILLHHRRLSLVAIIHLNSMRPNFFAFPFLPAFRPGHVILFWLWGTHRRVRRNNLGCGRLEDDGEQRSASVSFSSF